MKSSLLLAFNFFLLMACNSNTIIKKPHHLIPKDKMVAIIFDSYIAKTAKKRKNIQGSININYHALLYKKHNIDSASFHQSLKYYTSDIKQNEEILKQVKAKIQQQLSIAEKKLDSINSGK